MIQRQQTLWLLLATICAFLTFKFPFAIGKELIAANAAPTDMDLDAGSHLLLLVLTIGSIILSLVAIFMFKDRKMQGRLCLLGIVITVGIIAIYIWRYREIINPTLALWCILPFVLLVSYLMAYRNIRADEKLVKSLDKLR